MKLATWSHAQGIPSLGVVHDQNRQIFDVGAAAELAAERHIGDMQDLIDGGEGALARVRALFDRFAEDPSNNRAVADINLHAPLPRPMQLRDMCIYPDHIRQAIMGMQRVLARLNGQPLPAQIPVPDIPPLFRERPIYYKCNRLSVVGPDAVIRRPPSSRFFDFELELGIVIGRTGTNIPAENAPDHVFGYCLYNDFSARDLQKIETAAGFGPCKGKDFDTGNAMGPWIVTADEIPDPHALTMSARVNGETWCEGSSAGPLHSYWDVIAYLSRDETLYAGEVIGGGTINTGSGLEIDRFLADGDIVEIEAQGIGILRNRIANSAEDEG
jgi:2-keto-4-pentenoate hydratase/2-oxohepta-3-ene-1,7-dioic acid hydratase in catechol pathway